MARTSKPISTVSFNSQTFLEFALSSLLDDGIIEFYAYILHSGEDHEGEEFRGKDHFHLILYPAKLVDTTILRKRFAEPVPGGLPLNCLPFQKCASLPDFYLYALHSKPYLLRKGLTKQYHYTQSDFVASDDYFLSDQLMSAFAKFREKDSLGKLADAASAGIPFAVVLQTSGIPVQQVANAKIAYDVLAGLPKIE